MTKNAIMMSIQPNWVEKIALLKKTIEVRKSFLEDYVGWIYIYCTKTKILGNLIKIGNKETAKTLKKRRGDITGINKSFMKDGDMDLQGKVIGRFWCNGVEEVFTPTYLTEDDYAYSCDNIEELLKNACLSEEELYNYIGEETYHFFAISISKVEIFDKPKSISCYHNREFTRYLNDYDVDTETHFNEVSGKTRLKKAPQSWCYVTGD